MENEEYSSSTSNEDKFKILLKRIHNNLLKEKGFKKVNQNFRLIFEKQGMYFGYIINFQKSAYNDRDELRFTINLGRLHSNKMINENFKEYDCNIFKDRERLAVLSPQYHYDKWWSIVPSSNMKQLEDELMNLLQNKAFPWFGLT